MVEAVRFASCWVSGAVGLEASWPGGWEVVAAVVVGLPTLEK